MSQNQKILAVLLQIEQVVSRYSDDELSEKCREAGKDFFAFMQSQGVHPGWCQKLIVDTLGIHPMKLWRIRDIKLLRKAIYAYCNTMEVTPIRRDDQPHRPPYRVAQDTANFFFGRTDRP
jgi:hypothetical protein